MRCEESLKMLRFTSMLLSFILVNLTEILNVISLFLRMMQFGESKTYECSMQLKCIVL